MGILVPGCRNGLFWGTMSIVENPGELTFGPRVRKVLIYWCIGTLIYRYFGAKMVDSVSPSRWGENQPVILNGLAREGKFTYVGILAYIDILVY